MQSSGRIKVADLNEMLTCMLCNGYYIDATTIIECLHSFCKTCIVTYLETNKYCPKCEVQVHKTQPLKNIRSDQTLQEIVYKVVPGLFKNEMKQRRDFYSQPDPKIQRSIPSSSEKRGDVWGCDRLIFTPEDIISISLEYCPANLPLPINLPTSIYSTESLQSCNDGAHNQTHRRYLRCPAAITVYHLKKFLRAKFGLNQNKKLEILYMHDILKDQYTLIDLAYIYSWKRNEPLRLFYKMADEAGNLVPKTVSKPSETVEGVSLEVNVSDPEIASASSSVTLLSANAAMATAPSSRHPSPPPSPQMAAEPNYIKIDKPNSASLLNEQATKVQKILAHKSILKSPLSTSKVPSKVKYKPYVTMPIIRNVESYNRHKLFERHISSDKTETDTEKNKPLDGHKKKSVTFSLDLVQTFYKNPRYKSSKHSGKSSIFRTSKVNSSPVSNVVNMRNGILMGKRS